MDELGTNSLSMNGAGAKVEEIQAHVECRPGRNNSSFQVRDPKNKWPRLVHQPAGPALGGAGFEQPAIGTCLALHELPRAISRPRTFRGTGNPAQGRTQPSPNQIRRLAGPKLDPAMGGKVEAQRIAAETQLLIVFERKKRKKYWYVWN